MNLLRLLELKFKTLTRTQHTNYNRFRKYYSKDYNFIY